jgi:hypothetical protein
MNTETSNYAKNAVAELVIVLKDEMDIINVRTMNVEIDLARGTVSIKATVDICIDL